MGNFMGDNRRFLKLKCAFLAAAVAVAPLCLSGCFETKPPRVTHSMADEDVKPGSPTEASPTPTATPTPDPKFEALAMAEKAGLTEAELKGKYELFKKYYEIVSKNGMKIALFSYTYGTNGNDARDKYPNAVHYLPENAEEEKALLAQNKHVKVHTISSRKEANEYLEKLEKNKSH